MVTVPAPESRPGCGRIITVGPARGTVTRVMSAAVVCVRGDVGGKGRPPPGTAAGALEVYQPGTGAVLDRTGSSSVPGTLRSSALALRSFTSARWSWYPSRCPLRYPHGQNTHSPVTTPAT